MKLVIVESPTKAKTIGGFLGRGYTVTSSFGHIRDLPKSKLGIDVEKHFTPHYIIPLKARKRVTELKKLTAKADTLILATDEDREGEAIAWHLVKALSLDEGKIQNAKGKSVERIVFHEITKSAINEALKNPRAIDIKLVDAQQARRILDRLVGYKLSPLLWRKVKSGLSAGRVQSVAVRLLVEREREIEAFKPEEYWTIGADLNTKSNALFAAFLAAKNGKTLDKLAIHSQGEAAAIVTHLTSAVWQVANLERKAVTRQPFPPHITSTLQREAANRFHFSPRFTMRLAQELYEGVELPGEGNAGLITYMRTDSVHLAASAVAEARAVIKKGYGEEYCAKAPRQYRSKVKGAQEAHEAIRPTSFSRTPDMLRNVLTPPQYKLYALIWARALASQMAEAELDTVTIDVDALPNAASADRYLFRANGQTIRFPGFLKVYQLKTKEVELPEVAVREPLTLEKLTPTEHFTEALPRFNEASLIKKLEEYGIGRPSTYAPTISTILDRGYVEKFERALKPTEIGKLVNDLLVEHFPNIVDYQFTAKMEENLDAIAEGKQQWQPVIEEFYTPFEETLKKKEAEIDKVVETSDEKCPECGAPMVVRYGRFGKFLACTRYPECKGKRQLKNGGANGETVAEAPKVTNEKCPECGTPMVIKHGRFGEFLACTRYPECKGTKPIHKTIGVKCPQCGTGEIAVRRGKSGRPFYGCTNYPKCNFVLFSKPTGEKCPTCQSLLIYAAKGQVKCSSKTCDFVKEGTTRSDSNN
ncbi:MAG: type I DNA topoisomerase [Parcubacteria group bacterium]|nr:type I DNA topoisomerase [Parcubacteria group bacterium]